ncbi:hypothetical protein ACFL6S_25470 [Candidatus Poribacteria bacterium]
MNRFQLVDQLRELKSNGFGIRIWEDYSKLIVSGIELRGGGWTGSEDRPMYTFPALIDIPPDFPITVPGKGGFTHPRYAVHIPLIKHNGSKLSHLHECRHVPWYWFCFEGITWNPRTDNLFTLLQIIEYSIYRRRK